MNAQIEVTTEPTVRTRRTILLANGDRDLTVVALKESGVLLIEQDDDQRITVPLSMYPAFLKALHETVAE